MVLSFTPVGGKDNTISFGGRRVAVSPAGTGPGTPGSEVYYPSIPQRSYPGYLVHAPQLRLGSEKTRNEAFPTDKLPGVPGYPGAYQFSIAACHTITSDCQHKFRIGACHTTRVLLLAIVSTNLQPLLVKLLPAIVSTVLLVPQELQAELP
eukprot:2608206-Rhodomonas_salina.1